MPPNVPVNPPPAKRRRSLFRIIAVDFALTLVAITAVLLAIRMRQGDKPKDIADAAQVTVQVIDRNDCHVIAWEAATSGGARIDAPATTPPPGTDIPAGLPQLWLVAEAGTGRLTVSIQLQLRDNCQGQEAALAAADRLMNSYGRRTKHGEDFPKFVERFEQLVQLAKARQQTDEAKALLAELEEDLFSKTRHVFCNRNWRGVQPPDPHGVGIGHAAYRIDRFATILGVVPPPQLYARYLQSDFTGFPDEPSHPLAHYYCLKGLGVPAAPAHKEAMADERSQRQAYKVLADPNSDDGKYLAARCRLIKALDALLFSDPNGPPLSATCLGDRRAWGDCVAHLLATEIIARFAAGTNVKFEVTVQASGDQKGPAVFRGQVPLIALQTRGQVELFTIRFGGGERPSTIEWAGSATAAP